MGMKISADDAGGARPTDASRGGGDGDGQFHSSCRPDLQSISFIDGEQHFPVVKVGGVGGAPGQILYDRISSHL